MRFTRDRYNDLNDAVGRRREAGVLARRGPGSGAQLLPSFPAYTRSRVLRAAPRARYVFVSKGMRSRLVRLLRRWLRVEGGPLSGLTILQSGSLVQNGDSKRCVSCMTPAVTRGRCWP